MKEDEGETTKESEESEEELGARPKQFEIDLNKEIDLELIDTEKYYTPQELFNLFHSKPKNPDKND